MKKIRCCIIMLLIILCISGCTKSEGVEKELRQEYKVMSVYQYVSTTTNNFGGVLKEELKYFFTYLGNNGQLYQVDEYQHLEYGLTKVCVGKENKYVVIDKGIDKYRYLYLTEDTLINMSKK